MLFRPKLVELLKLMKSNLAAPPLVYQTTASLGLAQVQLHSPKVVVATGAAARALKNGITLPKIKSSSPIKHKHIRSLSDHLRAQSIKFSIGWTFERARTSICACYGDWSGNYDRASIKKIWKRHSFAMAPHRFVEGCLGIPGGGKWSFILVACG